MNNDLTLYKVFTQLKHVMCHTKKDQSQKLNTTHSLIAC